MLELNFSKFPLLETERLLFRRFTKEDANDLFELRTNENVLRYIEKPKMKDVNEALEMIENINNSIDKNELIAWVIELKENKQNIGNISFWRIIKEHYRTEIGYTHTPEHWGKGIMTEAIKKIIDYGFSEIKFHSIEANVNPLNLASIKLLERTGFVREAYFRENYYFNGKFYDSLIFSLINSNNEH